MTPSQSLQRDFLVYLLQSDIIDIGIRQLKGYHETGELKQDAKYINIYSHPSGCYSGILEFVPEYQASAYRGLDKRRDRYVRAAPD